MSGSKLVSTRRTILLSLQQGFPAKPARININYLKTCLSYTSENFR